ncbi:hypothetical protein F4780DRAFT_315127 [Xylariomycetidae sp. FL0641]|nr:hypothetical protein F4780DRAFT_315127 [Xylariomycetidae sp. FL0641]
MLRSILLSLAAAAAVGALPNVTVVPKENVCSNWPFYRGYMDLAGPLYIFPESTGTEIDGCKGATVEISEVTVAKGWLGIYPVKDAAEYPVQCQAFGSAEMLAVQTADAGYVPLSISEYIYHEYDGLIFVDTVTVGAPIEPHWHYYANGTRQDGTYIGWNNHTTWAYRLDEASGHYAMRLLTDDDQTLYENEFLGFARAGLPGYPD